MTATNTDPGAAPHLELAAYRDQFAAVVLAHIKTELPEGEWEYLRQFAGYALSCVFTPEGLVSEAIEESQLSVNETLIPEFRRLSIVVGTIEGQPVHYVSGEGIYIWAPRPEKCWTLSLWLTHPSYPPGW